MKFFLDGIFSEFEMSMIFLLYFEIRVNFGNIAEKI